ncbi:response regulator transcription factor [Miniphocaeibacter halophilus]|uniref:Response regulator n=1 Tax=Miniphocaeibacter halophilus TaxID=2931922 RepID=A0AC61MSZ3_9FIRM|nr:response regulator [Miniphocaeibacter halophilus]QQK08676.1 response regulator [Miniphocaeibacter halophilus]
MKLLYAEDEKQLSRAISTILEYSGYEVDNAFDGEEALNLAINNNYDVIILDIMMPKLDGIQVLKEIRNKNISTPIIMVTAKSENEDKINGLDSGADDYLAKPFQTNELIARIKALIRRNNKFIETYNFGDVLYNIADSKLEKENKSLILNKEEVKILNKFITNIDGKIEIEQLLSTLKYENKEENHSKIRLYIAYINKKFQELESDFEIYGDIEYGFKLGIKNVQ